MSWLDKCRNRKPFRAGLCATWGPDTEFGAPVRLDVDVELANDEQDHLELHIMAGLDVKSCRKLGLTSTNMGGQCLDDAVQHLGRCGLRCEALESMVPIWKDWHLNCMHAGTPRQDACIDEYRRRHPDWRYDFTEACGILARVGLCEDDEYLVDGIPYAYGSSWLYREIPDDVLESLGRILDSGLEIVKKGELNVEKKDSVEAC